MFGGTQVPHSHGLGPAGQACRSPAGHQENPSFAKCGTGLAERTQPAELVTGTSSLGTASGSSLLCNQALGLGCRLGPRPRLVGSKAKWTAGGGRLLAAQAQDGAVGSWVVGRRQRGHLEWEIPLHSGIPPHGHLLVQLPFTLALETAPFPVSRNPPPSSHPCPHTEPD